MIYLFLINNNDIIFILKKNALKKQKIEIIRPTHDDS